MTENTEKKYATVHEDNAKRIVQAGDGKYVFNLLEAEGFDIGPHYTSARGMPVRGDKVQVVLAHKAKGTGARLHTHPNEQFNYILQGHVRYQVADQEGIAGPGTLLYFPANVPHLTIATEEEDVIFFASKDTSFDISGEAVDGTRSGAHFDPGCKPSEG